MISYPRFQDIADDLNIDAIKYSTPKYRNDELVGFLRTLDPLVQSKNKMIQNLTKQEKQELDKNFKSCVNMVKALYEILEKNPKRYFSTFKDDSDYKGAQIYFDRAFQYKYGGEFKRLSKAKNSNINECLKQIDTIYSGVQKYLQDLQLDKDVTPPVYKFTMLHPYDAKKNVKVTIRFDYLP